MSILDRLMYDPQAHTFMRANQFIGTVGEYLQAHPDELAADLFNPKRGVTITSLYGEHAELFQSLHARLLKALETYGDDVMQMPQLEQAFKDYATLSHDLSGVGIDVHAQAVGFGFEVSDIFALAECGRDLMSEQEEQTLLGFGKPGIHAFR